MKSDRYFCLRHVKNVDCWDHAQHTLCGDIKCRDAVYATTVVLNAYGVVLCRTEYIDHIASNRKLALNRNDFTARVAIVYEVQDELPVPDGVCS